MLKLADILMRAGLSAGEINTAIADGDFPRPRSIVRGEPHYSEEEVQRWIISCRPELRREHKRGWKARC